MKKIIIWSAIVISGVMVAGALASESRPKNAPEPATVVEATTTPVPTATSTFTPTPKPTATKPVPTSTPAPKVEQKESSSCDPNYSGACVPIASDVDCSSGNGNGPAYVVGPVRIIGNDIYDLDRDGDGVGCENG